MSAAHAGLGALGLVALASAPARAEEAHRRLTLTVNVPYLLVPVYQLNAELAVHPR